MKLALGTVQFGLDYGISNRLGRPSAAAVAAIVAACSRHDIDLIDTAPAYGDCERVLGRALPAGGRFRIVTKTPGAGALEAGEVGRSLQRSLEALGCRSLYGLLVHRCDDLLGDRGEALWGELRGLQERGLVEKIGASVYTGGEIDALLERCTPDIVQLPLNALDRRLLAGGQLRRLQERGVEIHARSVFLQGLLLLDPQALPPWFDRARPLLAGYRRLLRDAGLTPVAGALCAVRAVDEVDRVLIGAAAPEQVEECARAFGLPCPAGLAAALGALACDDPDVVDPRRWPGPAPG